MTRYHGPRARKGRLKTLSLVDAAQHCCEHDGCDANGQAVYDLEGRRAGFYCSSHRYAHGYCNSCGNALTADERLWCAACRRR
jgi:hypothetical protein